MKWLIALLLGGCAALVLDEDPNPDEIYDCHQLGQFLICAPERANA